MRTAAMEVCSKIQASGDSAEVFAARTIREAIEHLP
jgi:hypothetical protein